MAERESVGLGADGFEELAEDVVDPGDVLSGADQVSGFEEEADDSGGRAFGPLRVFEDFVFKGRGELIVKGLGGRVGHAEAGEHGPDGADAVGHVFFVDDVGLAELHGEGGHAALDERAGEGFFEQFHVGRVLLLGDHEEAGGPGKGLSLLEGVLVLGAGVGVNEHVGDGLDPVVVQVNDQGGPGLHDAGEDGVGDALGERAVLVSGEGAVQVLLGQADAAGAGLEADGVHEGEAEERALFERAFFEALEDFLDHDHASDLVAVHAGGEPDHGPGHGRPDLHHGQAAHGEVGPGEDLEEGVFDLLRGSGVTLVHARILRAHGVSDVSEVFQSLLDLGLFLGAVLFALDFGNVAEDFEGLHDLEG